MDDDDDFAGGLALADAIGDSLQISARTFNRVLSKGLKDALVDGKKLEDVLKRAALSISNASLSSALRPLTGLVGQGLSSLVGSLTGSLTGGLGKATSAVPFAEGGVIGTPTAFGLPGGRVGLMGEAGREAILPLARGTDGRLGVALEGGGTGSPQVTVNITTSDAESFRRSESQVTAMLARAVVRGHRGL